MIKVEEKERVERFKKNVGDLIPMTKIGKYHYYYMVRSPLNPDEQKYLIYPINVETGKEEIDCGIFASKKELLNLENLSPEEVIKTASKDKEEIENKLLEKQEQEIKDNG